MLPVKPLGKHIPDERWISYLGIACWGQSARNILDREAFKAVCILTCVTFAWDDMDRSLHNLDAYLPELRKICHKYYSKEDAPIAYEAARAFATSDHMFRGSPILRALCSSGLDHYFWYRVLDVGTDYWLKILYPVYRDHEFTEHAKTGLSALLATRSFTVVNDVFSFDREKMLSQIANCFHRIDIEDSDAFRDFLEQRLDEMAADIRCIQAFGEKTRNILFDLPHGNFIWHRTNVRYRDGVNFVNSRIE